MARVLFTAVVADMRNKLNGTVFSKNKAGAYTRTKVTPVNPQSTSQVANRQRLSQFSQLWRTLTLAQITSWNDLAKSQPFGTDIFGNPKYLSGLSLFVKLNTNISIAGGTQIKNTPTLTTPPAALLDNATIGVTAGVLTTMTVDYTLATTPVNTAIVVYATRSYPVSQTYNTNLYRLVHVADAILTDSLDIVTSYKAQFGSPTVGQQVGLFVETIDKASGMRIKGSELITIALPE